MIGTLSLTSHSHHSKSKFNLSNPASPQNAQRSSVKKFHAFNLAFKGNEDDNLSRKQKAKEFIQDLKGKLDAVQDKGGPIKLKEKIREHTKLLYEILDNIFSLYNMNIQIINTEQSDSAIKIEPVSHNAKAIHVLTCIAIVLNKFPYSFLKTIEMNRFTICSRTYLRNEQHSILYTNRVMMNALFMIDIHDTYEKVERHFLRIVLYHVQKKCPSLYSEWPQEKLLLSPSQEAKKIFFGKTFTNSIGGLSPTNSRKSLSPRKAAEGKKHKANISTEEMKSREVLETLHKMIKNPKETLEKNGDILQLKAYFIKEKLESVDPIGICAEWWEDLPKCTHYVVEGPSGEFAIKY